MFEYTVTIDYKEFLFSRREPAMTFAEEAALTQTDNYKISIEVKYIPKVEPEQTQEQEKSYAPHLNDETKN